MRKTLLLILALGLMITCVVCGQTSSFAASSNSVSLANNSNALQEKIKVAFIVPNAPNQGWLITTDGVEIGAKDNNIDLTTFTFMSGDTVSWLNCFDDAKNAGVDAIVFGGANKELVHSIEEAVADGYICVEIDTPSGAEGTFRLGIDNKSAARAGGEWMAKRLGGKGTVVIVNGLQTTTSGIERRSGFIEGVEGTDIEIFEVAADWNQEKALNGVEDALTALNEQVDAIYCAWDGATMAVASVLEQRDMVDRVVLMGFDGAADALKLMREDIVDADVGQPLFALGYEGMNLVVKVMKGEVERGDAGAIQLPTIVITPENLEQYIKDSGLESYM